MSFNLTQLSLVESGVRVANPSRSRVLTASAHLTERVIGPAAADLLDLLYTVIEKGHVQPATRARAHTTVQTIAFNRGGSVHDGDPSRKTDAVGQYLFKVYNLVRVVENRDPYYTGDILLRRRVLHEFGAEVIYYGAQISRVSAAEAYLEMTFSGFLSLAQTTRDAAVAALVAGSLETARTICLEGVS